MKTRSLYFNLNCIKGLLVVCFVLCTTISYAQSLNINAGSGVTTTQLVDSLFDSSFSISNITECGNQLARGYFNNVNTNEPLNNGIIISTGKAGDAEGPNNATYGANTAFSSSVTPDSNLLAIVSANSTFKDLYKLEFDIVPQVDTLIFNYSFGSEEYLNYAPPIDMSGAYNDVFGIFVSGPGINGTQNIATIPGSTSNVSVFTINPKYNTSYFIDNTSNTPSSIQYNGFTKKMQAKIAVTKGRTYHIKIAIADLRDNIVDSGVFIKASGKNSNNSSTLPVKMVSWEAKNQGSKNALKWETAEESNNNYFEIERSADGRGFYAISTLPGHGTCNNSNQYQYEDNAPDNGTNYYRLKQVDFNGNYQYTPVVMVVNNIKGRSLSIEAHTIPASGNFSIYIQATDKVQGTLEIINIVGKQVFQLPVELQEGRNEFQCKVSSELPHGVYFLNFNSQATANVLERFIY